MALKSVNSGGRKFITPDESFGTTSMEVGGSIEGYLILIDSYTDKDDLVKTPMYFLRKDNTVLRIYPSGNIKYAIEDGKLVIGQFTQIVRVEDVKVKGRTSSKFDVLQDDEDVVNIDEVLPPLYKKSMDAFAARKDAEKQQQPAGSGTVTRGMTKGEKSRAGIAAKAKLLD